MAILDPNKDFHVVARAAIEKNSSQFAGVQRPLENVRYELEMPLQLNPDEDPLPCRETPEETAEISKIFSAQLHALYAEVASFQARSLASIEEANLAPIDGEKGLAVHVTIGGQSFDIYPHCHHRLYHARRLTLQDPETLPTLPFVHKLRILTANNHDNPYHFGRARPISLRVPLECLVRLPSATEINCPWLWERMPIAVGGRTERHYTRLWEGPWRDARHEFGAAVEELDQRIPATLTKAKLYFFRARALADEDHSRVMPNLVYPAARDPVSLGLRTLATKLEELSLRAFITDDLFPPPEAPWSRMRRLYIEFHPFRPDGSWYFDGPDGKNPHPQGFIVSDEHYPPHRDTPEDKEIDEEWNYHPSADCGEPQPDMFRTEPVTDKIEPLISAFASAVKNMGALEEAELFTYLWWYPAENREHVVGEPFPDTSDEGVYKWGLRYVSGNAAGKGSVQWQVGAWRPSQDVMMLFEELGEQEYLDFEKQERRRIKQDFLE
ncbi:hypothetical protein B0I35DRAFT_483822 [Stachybotrys elegans]|uniref:Uncharacterized protein n=1 Tax=Stachybotrys elegans TaxID=80388 RepID=A0A8K0SG23_9HYPO|nr:hypothetical protein B0I35DRAFT_483822 [Stachybotrys elegans]